MVVVVVVRSLIVFFTLFQIRKLQQVAKELEERMKNITDDLRQREAETEKLRQSLRNTPPNDPAYVCIHDMGIKEILAWPFHYQ